MSGKLREKYRQWAYNIPFLCSLLITKSFVLSNRLDHFLFFQNPAIEIVNMDLKYILFCFLLAFCSKCCNPLFAQNYSLSNWTVEDGLSSNDVVDLLQDKDGFIWVATEHGLNKFDGYTFEKHRYDPRDSTSLGANFINNICQDEAGNIWVNLGVGILSKYDRLSKKFTNYVFENHETYIYDFKFIEDWGMCIATNKGLFTIDNYTYKLRLLNLGKKESPRSVFNIFPISSKGIYLTTNKGFEIYNNAVNALEPTYFIDQPDTILFEYPIGKLYEDSKGKIWIQTHSGSLCESEDGMYFKKSLLIQPEFGPRAGGQLFISELDENTKVFFSKSCDLYSYSKSNQEWSPFPIQNKDIHLAFNDNSGNIWVYTDENELLKWNGKSWDSIIYLGDDLEHWEINHVFVDDKEGIWLTTRGKGIWRIYNRKWPISSLRNSNSDAPINMEITALSLDNKNFMWVGTYNNIWRYYFEREELKPFFLESKNENLFSGFKINDVARTTTGDIYVATNQGFFKIEEEGEKCNHYNHFTINDKKGALDYTRWVLPISSDKVWVGSSKGLFLYDVLNDNFEYYGPNQKDRKFLRGSDIQCIMQVDDTSFLVGYTKYGADLVTFDYTDNSISSQKMLYKNAQMEQSEYMTINTFYRADSTLWAGSFSKGLLKVDLNNLSLQPLSEDFPIIPNVRGIQEDMKGTLWVSSIDGLRSVNPDDQTFYRFSKASGLVSNQFKMNCAVKDHAGNLYFGSKNGLNKVEPSKWNNQDTVATPILTDFKKYDKSIVFEQYLDEVEIIYLSHQDDFITFKFVAPTYDNPGDVQYAYHLEGFDSNWRYCESERSATYTNLDPGEYIFKVRAGNKGGFLNSKTKKIQIIIAPPFWQTSWFMLLVIGLLIMVYWMFYKIQSKIRSNRLKTIAEIRQKAADDFHDELGHRLTKIGLFVESLMLQKDTFPEKSAHILRKIQDNANELYHSTRDFIWAINPSKDSAIELFILLRDFGDELYDETDIQFSVNGLKEEYKDYLLDMDLKRQLVLIFKEAMNNALKHSNCTKVVFKIEECKKHIIISLRDNGKGFILNHKKFGYGLGSMFNRSKKVGGILNVKTEIGKGTEILFKI